MDKPYYLAYEERYQAAFAAGIDYWGHDPGDTTLAEALDGWVKANRLSDRRVIEFACGEGAAGILLSRLGCRYLGVDIAPSAVEKTKQRLAGFQNAQVRLLDMVAQAAGDEYDAALDCSGLHMLVTDQDRRAYLQNAFHSLKPGAPMLFFRELYQENAYTGACGSYAEWKAITGGDYDTPQLRHGRAGDRNIAVRIPLIPGRAKNRDGYIREMEEAGFIVEDFVEMAVNRQIPYSASLYVRKP